MKRNHVFKIAFALTLTSFFSLFVTGVTFSWFIKDNKIAFDGEIGTTQANYYESGDGSESTPFIISNPRHLYNLAWLQYLGTYNQVDTTTGKVPTYYFEIKNDIDMKGYVLPPIGTESNPFLSNFNANNCTISNLTISNVIDDDYIETYPSVVIKKDFNSQKAIVGFFGVIGTYNSSDSTITYDTSKNEVKNLYLDNLTITSKKDNLLIGVFAGYVNGTIDNCGVHYVKMNIKGATTKLDSFDNVSKFTLIGDYNKNSYSYDQDGSGQTQDWGGSIDIGSLAKRLNFITASTGEVDSSKQYPTYTASNYNATLYYNKEYFKWSDTASNGQYIGLCNTTYLPLNINLNEATISGDYEGEMGSYYTSTQEGEPILTTNTGYIVGRNSTSNATPRLHNKYFNKSKNGIIYSVYATDQGGTISATDSDNDNFYDIFTVDNLSLFYIDTSDGTTYRISDNDNKNKTRSTAISSKSISTKDVETCGFTNTKSGYYSVKSQFSQMLNDENTDDILNQGNININGVQLFKAKNLSKSTFSDVTLNKNTYDTFEMYEGGFNFELTKTGTVKMVVGAYTSTNTGHILPSIYQVTRSQDNKKIESSKKITAIYKSETTYYQQYEDGTFNNGSTEVPSGAAKIFDLNKLYGTEFDSSSSQTGYMLQNCAYYIEIPLNAGDYFFGADSNTNQCPYIMYLDIGANAEGDSDTRTELSNFDFVTKDSNSLTKIKTKNDDGTYSANNDYSKSNVTFKIGDTTGDTTLAFRRIDQDTNGVLYYQSVDSILTPSGTGKNNEASDDNCNSKKS